MKKIHAKINSLHFSRVISSVFASGPGDQDSIPGRVIQKTQKMVLATSLLNTQHFKIRTKGKVPQTRESRSVISFEKGASG